MHYAYRIFLTDFIHIRLTGNHVQRSGRKTIDKWVINTAVYQTMWNNKIIHAIKFEYVYIETTICINTIKSR